MEWVGVGTVVLVAVIVAVALVAMARRSGRGAQLARSALVHALAGPALGALPVLGWIVLSGEREIVQMTVFVLFFAYLLGAVPALLAGLCMGALPAGLHSGMRVALAPAIGAVVTGALAWPLLDQDLDRAIYPAGFGALAGLLLELARLGSGWRSRRRAAAAPAAT
jgi:hypothetical protein